MTATNHGLSGALIGALLPLPLAVPLAFVSHFVLDTLPHYGIPHELRNASQKYKLVVAADLTVGLALLVFAAIFHKWKMAVCGLTAYSPDSLWAVYYFTHGRSLHLKPNNKFLRFHIWIQRYERPWGIFIELAAAAAMLPFVVAAVLN